MLKTDSPCVQICQVDATSGYCMGCWRSLTEIATWMEYTDLQKHAILSQLPTRRATLNVCNLTD